MVAAMMEKEQRKRASVLHSSVERAGRDWHFEETMDLSFAYNPAKRKGGGVDVIASREDGFGVGA